MQPPEMSERGLVNDTEPRFLVIGQIMKPHGVRGEVRVRPYTDDPTRFTWLKTAYLGHDDEQPTAYAVATARMHQDVALLRFEGIDDRDAADSLRGLVVYVPLEDAIPLEEDEYYLFELEGMSVVTVTGEALGTLVSVIETKANNVFVVQGPRGEVLLPDIADVVKEIDFDNGRILIDPLPGLLPE